MSEYITKAKAIEIAESLRHIAGNGITDAFIKGIEGVEATEVIVNKTDYTGKCGTCQWFERNGQERHGWCHKRPYGENTAHDLQHPYMTVPMSRQGCMKYYSDRAYITP